MPLTATDPTNKNSASFQSAPFTLQTNKLQDQHSELKEKDPTWYETAFPFKSEEFGKLVLPENVIKAKLVSLNNYGATVPPGLIKNSRGHH